MLFCYSLCWILLEIVSLLITLKMKRLYLFILSLVAVGTLQAQLFSDDLESYTVGDYLGVVGGANWTTWSGTTGGGEDVQITNVQASSGNNGIYFSSTASGGGPQDVVLDFGQQYTSGIFTFESDFYVEAGKGAYWNFQATPIIGTTWALNCYMDNGVVDMDGFANAPYPENTWFTLRIEANLTLQLWKLYIDGNFVATWNNPVNQLASMDIFPTQGNGFYMDDVSFDHQPYTLQNLNAGASGLNMVGALAGMIVYPRVKIVNAGLNNITSFDVTLDYNGNQVTENITGQNLASLAGYEVTFTTPYTLVAGQNTATAIISNVNGMGADDDINDDTLAINLSPIVPAAGKIVVGEEGTGTWCQWCPRGDVYMKIWEERYGDNFAGIAVHNGDPMTDADYDAGIGGLISGYPSALVDRLSDVDPSGMGPQINSQLQIAPVATLLNGASLNGTVLDVSVTYTFNQALAGDYRVSCALTEDSVTGTGSGYNQSNAYAGGGNGPMGGYENLPSSVPASIMVYDHVARAIGGTFAGMSNAWGGPISNGSIYTVNFSFNIDPTWDLSKMHIVGMLIQPNGRMENAGYTTVDEAIANGLIIGLEGEESEYLDGPDRTLEVYPNPAGDRAYAGLNLTGSSEVALSVFDMTGKRISHRSYGTLDGAQVLPLELEGMAPGLYTIKVMVNGQPFSKKLMVK